MNKIRRTLTTILQTAVVCSLLAVALPLSRHAIVRAQVAENPAIPRERIIFPVASWRLDETSGTTARDSQGTNHGTHAPGVTVGAPRLSTGSPPGYPEIYFSADYNGTSGRTTISSSAALNPTGAITLETWIRPNALPASSATTSTILRKDAQYLLRVTSSGAVVFRLWIGGAIAEAVTPAGTIAPNKIYQVIATYNGSSQSVYVNGVAKVTRSQTGGIGTSINPLLIGASSSGGINDFFDGCIDGVAIYNAVQSATSIAERYNSTADKTPPDTTITSSPPASTPETAATFGFKATEAGSTFDCSLEGSTYTACQSPKSYAGLATGSHTFAVRAIDPVGNVDASPAKYTWTIAAPTPVSCTKVASNGASLSQFIGSLVAGDVGCLRAGVYGARGTYTVWYPSGTPTAPITLKGYPGEAAPTILGAIYISGDNLVLSGLLFDGPTGKIPSAGNEELDQVSIDGDNVEVSHCEVRNNGRHAGIFLNNAFNVRLIGNYIHDNGDRSNPNEANLDHGIYFASGSGLIANNVVENNYAHGIQLYTSASNVVVVQNTIVRNGRSGIIIGGQTTDCDPNTGCPPQPTNDLVVNNIIAFNKQNGVRSWQLTGAGNVVRNNLWWGNEEGDVSGESAGLTIFNNIQADPRFTGTFDYRLLSGSPAIDTADNSYTRPDDYLRTPRPQGGAPDIGAFEYKFDTGAVMCLPTFGNFGVDIRWPLRRAHGPPRALLEQSPGRGHPPLDERALRRPLPPRPAARPLPGRQPDSRPARQEAAPRHRPRTEPTHGDTGR
jgi:parallel beta-helix repeat protein